MPVALALPVVLAHEHEVADGADGEEAADGHRGGAEAAHGAGRARRRRRGALQRVVGHGRPRLHLRPHGERTMLSSSRCLVASYAQAFLFTGLPLLR